MKTAAVLACAASLAAATAIPPADILSHDLAKAAGMAGTTLRIETRAPEATLVTIQTHAPRSAPHFVVGQPSGVPVSRAVWQPPVSRAVGPEASHMNIRTLTNYYHAPESSHMNIMTIHHPRSAVASEEGPMATILPIAAPSASALASEEVVRGPGLQIPDSPIAPQTSMPAPSASALASHSIESEVVRGPGLQIPDTKIGVPAPDSGVAPRDVPPALPSICQGTRRACAEILADVKDLEEKGKELDEKTEQMKQLLYRLEDDEKTRVKAS